MNYEEREEGVADAIRADSLWRMRAYRLALFLGDLGWHDITKLTQDRRTMALSDQLYRALGSISANLARGTLVVLTKIELAFTNTRWAQPARAATGTGKPVIFWAIPSSITACSWSLKSSVCC